MEERSNKIIFGEDSGFHLDHKRNGDLDPAKTKNIVESLKTLISTEEALQELANRGYKMK